MIELLLFLAVVLMLVVVVLQILQMRKGGTGKLDSAMREELSLNRTESSNNFKDLRLEITSTQKAQADSLRQEMSATLTQLGKQVAESMSGNEKRIETMRGAVETKLTQIQTDNAKKLEEMRATVDEKLHATLEKRLGESFKLVSDRLELVHKGLGEMQGLANGVGDLKRVLTNVKTRGTWGEFQLKNLLEQILTPEQYDQNVAVKQGSLERVEFAVKLPGRDGETTWLPIDAKFPVEDYNRIQEAAERADADAVEAAGRQLEIRVKGCAKDISEKYLSPPQTTDFGMMFLPTEGLYAEVLRRPGLADTLQRQYRVCIAGPCTLAALLNSLQMGFRTLAIEKRSSEVWSLLGAVKGEFGKFGEVLGKVKDKLDQASKTIDDASTRTRAIERKLRDVQQMPSTEVDALLPPE